jgi:hypothetical protein
MPVEAKALACGCNGTSETFSSEAGKPTREGRSLLGLPMGRCQENNPRLLEQDGVLRSSVKNERFLSVRGNSVLVLATLDIRSKNEGH